MELFENKDEVVGMWALFFKIILTNHTPLFLFYIFRAMNLTQTDPVTSPCIIYSFGVGRESSWEVEFLNRTPCHIWAYDATVDRMGSQLKPCPHPRVHFNKIYISAKQGGENATLGYFIYEKGGLTKLGWCTLVELH